MGYLQIVRYANVNDLARRTAARLLDKLINLQSQNPNANICLSSGEAAMLLYSELGKIIANSPLDPKRLEIWWGDEGFLPSTSPDRLATKTLATLARTFPIDASLTHPMPGSQGQLDAAAAAQAYAKEVGETIFDVCVMAIGRDGETSSLFPGNLATEMTAETVVAVPDTSALPQERISFSIPAINTSNEVWLLASGRETAPWVKATIAGDETIPSGRIRGHLATYLLIDAAAASLIPYHQCAI
ncbi:MAG: 6-phosphogluconolactonase [Propionibacteriaceae bacterium]|nr:6-phosphogluconolactonase [Propionibacteriaceae bacterium]